MTLEYPINKNSVAYFSSVKVSFLNLSVLFANIINNPILLFYIKNCLFIPHHLSGVMNFCSYSVIHYEWWSFTVYMGAVFRTRVIIESLSEELFERVIIKSYRTCFITELGISIYLFGLFFFGLTCYICK